MFVSDLKLINYRNYSFIETSFNRGINFIIGNNAVGKTNIAESIYFLSLARSFKTNAETELIKEFEKEAFIESNVYSGNLKTNIKIALSNKGKRIIINNNKTKKVSELSNKVNVLLFTPKDVNLFKETPKSRRFFINLTIFKMNNEYQNSISRYEKILKDRNFELKKDNPDFTLINVYKDQLIKESFYIFKNRKLLINKLNKSINEVFKNISTRYRKITIKYDPFVDEDNENMYFQKLDNFYKKALKEDINKKVTTIGIHKEDFSIFLDERDVSKYGSQGENRMCALALKISPYLLIDKEEDKPIVILDDVLSELDNEHTTLLIKYLENFNQVFITATKRNKNINKNIYLIENNSIKQEG